MCYNNYLIKMSHSIHILSIQINTQSLEIVNHNIKLSFFANLMKGNLIDAARLLE